MLCIASAEGYFVDLNPTWERILGWSVDELTAEPFMNFIHGDDLEATVAETVKLQAGEDTVSFENRYRCRDGSYRWLEWRATFNEEEDLYYAVARDVTDAKEADEAVRTTSEELESSVRLLEQRNEEITLVNELGDLLQSCLSLEEGSEVMTHYCGRLFAGRTGAVSVISNSRNSVEVAASWGDGTLGESVFGPDQCWALRRGRAHVVSGKARGVTCPHVPDSADYVCVPMMAQGEAIGLLTLDLSSYRDGGAGTLLATSVAEHIGLALANFKLRESLRNQSIRDPLTDLFNRRFMMESLEREVRRATRTKRFVSVLSIDVDHFKAVNDTFGHEAGDAVLRVVGSTLASQFRADDIACRFGGEEFIVVLPEASPEDAVARAEELRAALAGQSVEVGQRVIEMPSVSVGVAAFPDHAETIEALLREADGALYRAKRDGRDRVVVADPGRSAT